MTATGWTRLLAWTVCAAAAGVGEAAKTNYVAVTGTNPAPPFTSWDLAAPSIQAAVAAATNGDVVLVSNGTYLISAEIALTNAITVRSTAGAAETTVEREAAFTNLPHHRIFRITGSAVLDGFTVRNGYLPLVIYPAASQGAGIYMSAGTVQNCVIHTNGIGNSWTSAGAGLYMTGSSKLLSSSVVSNYGGSGSSGVGIYATGSSLLISNRVAFNAGIGAGLVNQPKASFCVFENNAGSGVYGYTVTLSNCMVRYNTAATGGGLLMVNGNTILDTAIVSNSASTAGGGVYVSGAYEPLLFRRCIISGNTNASYPGVYFANINPDNGSRTFDLCRITDNPGGRSVYMSGVALPILFRNCTIAASQGLGVDVGSVVTNKAGALLYPVFQNTIVYGHATNIFSTNATLLSVLLTNSFTYSCSPQLTSPGLYNVSGNPLFVGAADGNYRLKSWSPCARSGTTNVLAFFKSDIELRPYGATVNMGCYEYLRKNPGGSLFTVR